MEHYLAGWIIQYGYFGVFAALSLGIVGLPIPDEVLLTYVGYHVYQGNLIYMFALISAFMGATTGITISYVIGSKLGLPFLHKFGPKIHITNERIERTQTLFKKYGSFLLFFGYFLPGVRHLTAYVAGISNLSFRRFILLAYSGALVWSTGFILLGHLLGERWYLVRNYVHRYGAYLIIVSVVVAAGIIAYRMLKRPKVSS